MTALKSIFLNYFYTQKVNKTPKLVSIVHKTKNFSQSAAAAKMFSIFRDSKVLQSR